MTALTEELFRDSEKYGRVIRIKGFHQENGTWYELNAAHSEIDLKECGAGQEVFLVIGENLNRERIAERVIPADLADEVWHNGQVYKGN